MKLFIDTKSRSVVFAEAGKDVVDFLFSLLHLPLASVVSLVGGASGSVGSLYHSADLEARLHGSGYGRPAAAMDPTLSCSSAASLFFMPAASFEPSRISFRCKNNYAGYGNLGISIQHCCLYMTDVAGTRCPNCGDPMTATLQHVSFDPSPFAAQSVDPTTSSPAAGADGSKILFRCTHQYSACRVRGVGCRLYMADVKSTACPNCDTPMTDALYYVSPAWPVRSGAGGSVQDQEAATYTVRDATSPRRRIRLSPATRCYADPGSRTSPRWRRGPCQSPTGRVCKSSVLCCIPRPSSLMFSASGSVVEGHKWDN